MIGRGLLILIAAITLGLSVAEQQLNTLTQRQEFVQILAMNRNNESVYTLEILGSSYRVSAVYEVAEIRNQDKSVSIYTPFATWIIPKYLYIDCHEELAWLDLHLKYLEQYIRQGWEMIKKT
jgi:hypothetical protein